MLDKLSSLSQKLSPGTRKVIGNVGRLFAERVFSMAIAFVVGIYVIRYLGSENFGVLSYSISFVSLFGSVATLGLKGIVVRNIVREESASNEILGTVLFLRLIGAAIAIVLIIVAIFQLEQQPKIRLLTIIISFQLLFTAATNTFELWFESQVLDGKAGIVRLAQMVFNAGTRLVLIWQSFALIAFGWTLLVSSIVNAAGMLWLYVAQGCSVKNWKISFSRGKAMLSDSWPLIFSAIAITLYMKIDQVMLGNMAGARAVGNYAAAVKFSEVWNFIPLAICSSVFPAIIRAKQRSKAEYYQQFQQLFDFVYWIALIIAIVISLMANFVVITFLGSEYIEAVAILRLHIWSGIFVFLSVARSKWLIEENMTRFSLVSTSVGAISNILLNLALIPAYEGKGAAIATLISYCISGYLSLVVYPPTAKVGWMLTKSLLSPFRWRQNLAYLRRLQQHFL
ncbi:MAG: flippase [Cyanobacteria bacterium J06600_6]